MKLFGVGCVWMLLLGFQAFSGEEAIPDTNLAVEIPANYQRSAPANTPEVLVQFAGPLNKTVIQVLKAQTGQKSKDVAQAFENLLGGQLWSMKRREQALVTINGNQALYRFYKAKSANGTVYVHAVFYPFGTQGVTVYALDMIGNQVLFKKTVQSLKKGTKAASIVTHKKSAQNGAVSRIKVTKSECSMIPPTGWNQTPGQQGAVMQLTSPDGNGQIVVNVMAVPAGQQPIAYRKLLEQTIAQNFANDTASGWQLKENRSETKNGIDFTLHRYFPSKVAQPVELMMIFAATKKNVLIFNVAIAGTHKVSYEPIALAAAYSLQHPQISWQKTAKSGNANSKQQKQDKSSSEQEFSIEELEKFETQLMSMLQQNEGALEAKKELGKVRWLIAVELRKKGDNENAVEYLMNSIDLDATVASRLEALGDWLDDLPEPAAAALGQSYYEDALELEPKRLSCRAKLAASYLASGESESALEHYRLLTTNFGKPLTTYMKELALAAISSSKEKEIVAFLIEVNQMQPKPMFAVTLAILQYGLGRKSAAIKNLQRAILTTKNPVTKRYAQQLLTTYQGGK